MEARLLLGSDDAQRDFGEENGSELRWGSGHGYGRGKWLRASLGGGGGGNVKW